MRKVFLFMMITPDGFFEGPGHDLSWHNVDKEFADFAIAQLKEIDTILFGRVTYQMMASFWSSELAKKQDPVTAEAMTRLPKVVFSKTLDKVDWENSRLVSSDAVEEVRKLKKQKGKKMAILGSSDLAVALAKAGIVDEFRLMVNPILLGKGKRLMDGLDSKLNLGLFKTKKFGNGNVLLYYRPKQ